VDVGKNFSPRTVIVVSFEQKFSCFLVQGGLGVGDDEKTLDGQEDVLQALKIKRMIKIEVLTMADRVFKK